MMDKIKYSFSPYLKELLLKTDEAVILDYIHRSVKMGIPGTDRHFAIRASNGLKSFKRIDVYVSTIGIIYLSSIENKKYN